MTAMFLTLPEILSIVMDVETHEISLHRIKTHRMTHFDSQTKHQAITVTMHFKRIQTTEQKDCILNKLKREKKHIYQLEM